MKKSFFWVIISIISLFAGYFASYSFFRHSNVKTNNDLLLCLQKNVVTSKNCVQPTSTVKLKPGQVPDRTVGWESFSVPDRYSLTFRHPVDQKIRVEGGGGDVILHHVFIGTTMILEAVSSGAEGLAGDNPADYENLVYNSIAQNTQPIWTNYNPGYSSEQLGNMTLYHFHTNILDASTSLDLSVRPTSGGLDLQGVLFDPAHGIDWLVYFNPKSEIMADDILRTMRFSQ